MYRKNQEIELTIEDMSVDGEGIGHHEGMTFFVKGAIVGDEIVAGITKVKKNLCYARVVYIINKSPYRSTEKCPKAKPCGGCQLQALDYGKQLELKVSHVKNNLIRVGGFEESVIDEVTEPIIGMDEPFYYRNKLQIPVGINKVGDVVTGFYLSHSHDIVPIDKCYLSYPIMDEVLSVIKEWVVEERVSIYHRRGVKNDPGKASGREGEGILRHILIRYGASTGELMVCLIGNVKWNSAPLKLKEKFDNLANRLKDIEGMTSLVLNENCKNTNVILGDKTNLLWGKETITDYIGDIAFNISAKSFYQVNPVQTKKLYDKVAEYADLTGSENVWDLYCGIGTIGLYLSGKVKSVFGVEVVPKAIEDAKSNAKLNGIDNATFVVGKVEEIIPKAKAPRPDIVIVDPPRKGCDVNLINAILELEPERVIYVSCNPSTLARDLKTLCEEKYELKKLTPTDMFPQTGHVETVVLMSRRI